VTTGQVSFPQASTEKTPRIGFVPQQDILPPTLTVFEALLFAARLRLPESLPDSEKQARVKEVMEKLGISDLAGVRIGSNEGNKCRGISGGEMRRVSIGLELVARPDVLILDEPTSGTVVSFRCIVTFLMFVRQAWTRYRLPKWLKCCMPSRTTRSILPRSSRRYISRGERFVTADTPQPNSAAARVYTRHSTRYWCSRTGGRCTAALVGSRLWST
jgi:hypothetical protein